MNSKIVLLSPRHSIGLLALLAAGCAGAERVDPVVAGEYEFGIFPTAETSAALYDELDYVNGVQVWLRHIPTASLYAMFAGLERDMGIDRPNRVAIFENRMDSKAIFLTANTESVYMIHYVDTYRDGPTVIEAPPGILGTLDDHYFRHVIDIGNTGPDQGRGGKYLILPPGYEGSVPDGYFVVRPRTYRSWWLGRGQLENGEAAPVAERFKENLKVYPLAKADNPPPMDFVNATGRDFNTIHNNDFRLFEEVAAVIQYEHPEALDARERGLLASIGITKDQPFAPDARMRAVLERAADAAYGITRAITWDTRDERAWVYPDRKWKTAFIGGSHEFLNADGSFNAEAATLFFYYATGITPAMAMKMVGRGSQYLYTNVDEGGNYLDGGKTYTLHYPPDIPAAAFWSVMMYDPETRSMLQTDQPYPGISSYTDPVFNDDGGIDFYFGPELPAGKPEANWLRTVPGKGWHTILRFYSPTEAFFEQTWRPEDIVEIR